MAPASYTILFTNQAAADLDAIFRYVSRQSPTGAGVLVTKLVKAIDSLALFPRRYRLIHPHSRIRQGTRMMVVTPYLVYYRVLEEQGAVRVLGVRHGARQRPRSI